MQENQISYQKVNLDFNGSKIRWLTDLKITPTDTFCIGSTEKRKKVTVWRTDNSELFSPELLAESDSIDGDVTEIKAKNKQEFFISTTNGTIYYYIHKERNLTLQYKWSKSNVQLNNSDTIINNFDFDSGCEELCTVGDDGSINFIRLYEPKNDSITSINYNDLCGLNSVLYVKQYEIAVADSLGRIKLWDTRNKDKIKSSMTLAIDGECSPILCLANHPNQQNLIAAGNLNGLIFIYDVRSQKSPLIMCHNHSQPIMEVCFNPFSCDNLLSCSFDNGALWLWNITNNELSSRWNDRNIDAKNFLPNNQFTLNSFDINNENILAINNNYTVFKLKNNNFM